MTEQTTVPADMTSDDAVKQHNLARQRQNPRRLWSLFWSLARPYWMHAPGAKANFVWVGFMGLVRSVLSVVFSYISRDFWTALQQKNHEMFWKQIILFTVVLVSALPILVWYAYAKDRLALRWRKWHTEKLLGDYFAARNYYEIDQLNTVDNPDQRIADDIDVFTSTSLNLFMTFFTSFVDLFNFSLILLTIYPKLFIVLILYSSAGTVIAVLIGRRLININFLQLKKEADFRYSLIRVRENAESIAFYNGEGREKGETNRRFYSAFLINIDLLVWSRHLAFFTTTYSYLIQILPLCIIAPLYFKGTIELGVVSQSQQAFGHILDDLSLIIDEFGRISAFSAGVDRLGELEEFVYLRFADLEDRSAMDSDTDEHSGSPNKSDSEQKFSRQLKPLNDFDSAADAEFAKTYGRDEVVQRFRMLRDKKTDHDEGGIDLLRAESGTANVYIKTIVTSEAGAVAQVEDLTLMTPDRHHRVLFENMSFRLEAGQRLLIVGPSGSGKSSALRALAGLWNHGRGTITRPRLDDMLFLPQKPYCTLGSLREQLVYPTPVSDSSATDLDLMAALEVVDLEKLPSRVGGFEENRDWSTVLSLGEQQRLAFARLIIGRPSLAILDECSSALDITSEDRLYSYLQRSELGYISVGHRPSLMKYHDKILRITSGGRSFALEDITDATVA